MVQNYPHKVHIGLYYENGKKINFNIDFKALVLQKDGHFGVILSNIGNVHKGRPDFLQIFGTPTYLIPMLSHPDLHTLKGTSYLDFQHSLLPPLAQKLICT